MEIKNGFRNRDSIRAFIVFITLCCFQINSFAAYAQLAAPPGWSAGTGASALYKVAATASNDGLWLANGTVRTNAALNVAGRMVTVPVGMRLAANASAVVAEGLFANQALLAAGVLAPLALGWMLDNDITWSLSGGFVKKTVREVETRCYRWGGIGVCMADKEAQCRSLGGTLNSNSAVCYDGFGHYYYSFTEEIGTGASMEYKTLNRSEFVDEMLPRTLPAPVANAYPSPLPVQNPVINPDPQMNPQPLKIPMGDPVPIPNTSPQQYRYPSTTVKPSTTTSDPWRVDLTPEDVTTTDPNATTSPNPESPSSSTPSTDTDLCQKNPEILACVKPDLDTPAGDIPKSEKTITYQDENLFGEGSCPADKVYTMTNGQTLKVWDWQDACEKALPMRFIIISLATFGAFLIVMPGSTRV